VHEDHHSLLRIQEEVNEIFTRFLSLGVQLGDILIGEHYSKLFILFFVRVSDFLFVKKFC